MRKREKINDADDVAYVVVAANADAAVFAAHAAIAKIDHDAVANDAAFAAVGALATDPIIDAAWVAAPPKAHKKCSRSRSSTNTLSF